jgi:4-amino-4-deoxy-L-arabinose transferase-like glycosyltransferase
LTKGPVALVLIAAPIFLHQFLDRRSVRISLRAWLAYLGVVFAVAAPWFVALAFLAPQAFVDFFWLHHVQRFVTPFDHEEPIWFFVPRIVIGMLPWSLAILPLALAVFSRTARSARRRPAALGFFLLSFSVGVGLFSLSGSKRPAYILPALPLLALALGTFMARALLRQRLGSVRWLASGGVMALFSLLVVGVYFWLPAYHRQFGLADQLAITLEAGDAAIVTYPKRWDSVSFYLRRDDVAAFDAQQHDALLADLQTRDQTLLLVKRQGALAELLTALPPTLELIPHGRLDGKVVVATVRRRGGSCRGGSSAPSAIAP